MKSVPKIKDHKIFHMQIFASSILLHSVQEVCDSSVASIHLTANVNPQWTVESNIQPNFFFVNVHHCVGSQLMDHSYFRVISQVTA